MNSKFNKIVVLILGALCLFINVHAQVNPTVLKEWKDRKYSMFIHFGVYSKLGGIWEGQKVTIGSSEQIQAHAQGLYSDLYENVAANFNPENWNADEIVKLAKDSGMKSIVVTAKHHDGFAMWDTKYSDFNIVQYTPFKRDIIKELSEACQRQGVAFGLYFSLIDWHFPAATPMTYYNTNLIPPAHHQYNLQQVEELLTKYGSISELWFEMGSLTKLQSQELRDLVKRLQPNCMISNRLGNNRGDFTVIGDNQESNYSVGVPWQKPASMFEETWGYRSWQERGDVNDKIREKLLNLIKVADRGGNFLLNIGPKGDGEVVDFERDVLLGIGAWLKTNGEAIYATEADPFHQNFEWGAVTTKANKIYLHLFNQPKSLISLPVKGKISKVTILGSNIKIKPVQKKDNLLITLPKEFIVGNLPRVVALEFKGGFTVSPLNIVPAEIPLNNQNAFPYQSISSIDYWTDFPSTIKNVWTVKSLKAATYTPILTYGIQEKGKIIDFEFNKSVQTLKLENDEEIKLENDLSSANFGSIFAQGPFLSNIDSLDGKIKDIDLNQDWGNKNPTKWKILGGYKNGTEYSFPTRISQSYYLLEEISSPKFQVVAVEFTAGDGIAVFLNGEKLFINNNPDRKETIKQTILLPLLEGKNQLVVKLFNRFQNQIKWNINFNVPQIYFQKKLKPVQLKKNAFYPVSWQLNNPPTPHEDLGIPNLSLSFKASNGGKKKR